MMTIHKNRSLGKRAIALCVLATFQSLTLAQVVQNTTTSFQYDPNGNVTQITDPLGHVTNQAFDALNRLTQQIQPAPAAGAARPTIAYTYDGQDQLATVTDPRNLVTRYTVDGLGNQTAIASPDSGTTSKTYDEAGNLITHTDARGKTTSYAYDALNRLTKVSYPTGAATTFTWDTDATPGTYPKGRLVMITDESGSTHYTYDLFGHVTGKTETPVVGSASYTVTYQYDQSANNTGHLLSMTYPSGNRINYTYDADGRIASLTLNPGNPTGGGTDTATTTPLLTGIRYHPLGIPIAWTWGNSTDTAANTYARSIDLDGRITSYPLGNALANGTVRTVSYDAASRIQATTHTGSGTGTATPANFNQSYGYDNLDRLTSFTGQTTSQGYGYDANGNRTSLAIGTASYADTIDTASNRLTATTGPTPTQIDSYDAVGDLTGNGSVSFAYSDRGRLAGVTTSAGTTTYLYNGLGQRVSKEGSAIASGSNAYVYDKAGHLIGEYDAAGKAIEETVYLNDMPVAVLQEVTTGKEHGNAKDKQDKKDKKKEPPGQARQQGGMQESVYYVYVDHLNAPRMITRSSDNQMVWRWDDADPFGMSPPDGNPVGLGTFTYNLRFPGQVYDQETGFFYNYYRYYDPQTGRYTQSDPIGLKGGSFSTYIYAGDNPNSNVDSTGRGVETPIIVVLFIYGAYETYEHYHEFIQCKRECKEKTKEQCDAGDTRGYHQCEARCVLGSWGGLGSKGPKGPTPEDPYP